MPKMVLYKGEWVRAGSWVTKPVDEQWKLVLKQFRDVELLLVRLNYLLFAEGSAYSAAQKEVHEDRLEDELWRIAELAERVASNFSKDRKAFQLESTSGRTQAEIDSYMAAAKRLRKEIAQV